MSTRTALAVTALAMVVLVLAACQPSLGVPGSAVSNNAPSPIATPTPTPAATPSASPAVQVRPAWVADLAGQLECDGPMIANMGQEVPEDVGPFDPAPTADGAIEGLLEVGMYAWLPKRGFESSRVEGHWALHRYVVDGALKAVVVSTNHFPEVPEEVGWEVVGLRACDPSEFDPAHGLPQETTLWLDAAGDLVRADRIFSRPGPGHCGWEGVTFLELGRDQYLRDVKGVLDSHTERPFRTVARLPGDAIDTGLHTDRLHLFTVPDERVVYVRTMDGTIERWSRSSEPIGCM